MENTEKMEEFETVVLEMDDGSEVEFAILDEFEMQDDKYVLLGEIEGDSVTDDPEHMLFMKVENDPECSEEEIVLTVIDDDAAYDAVVELLHRTGLKSNWDGIFWHLMPENSVPIGFIPIVISL